MPNACNYYTSMITDVSDLLEFVVQTLNTEVNHALGEDSHFFPG